jgi:hypothetical protein
MSGWQSDPTLTEAENLIAKAELLKVQFKDTHNEQIAPLLDELRRLSHEINGRIAEIRDT